MSFLRLFYVTTLLSLFFVPVPSLFAQFNIGKGKVMELYQQHCAMCHGADMQGGLGGSLLKEKWAHASNDQELAAVIKDGLESLGMPPFGATLSDEEVRSVVVLLNEMRAMAKGQQTADSHRSGAESQQNQQGTKFEVVTVVEGLSTPWSLKFFSDGRALITERSGNLRIWDNGRLSAPIAGTPKVWAHGQGGLLDVAFHPDYKNNGWVYLSYSESSGEQQGRSVGMTTIVRGRIKDHQWVDEERIFKVPSQFHSSSGVHFGTRLVFSEGYLFFSIGDRGAMQQAQDLTRPNGKVHRIHDDGRVPEDNPFIHQEGAYPTIWSYGNRNPQGLALHPKTGELWEAEHGPRGGDEINWIRKGLNYGWPVITYGINYDGRPISGKTEAPGMEQPQHYWTPSIAVCGIDFYTGERFPDWKNNLFAGGLASQELHRLVIEDSKVVKTELVLRAPGRIRDVVNGPYGYLYLVLNGPDQVIRLQPVD